MSCDQGSSGGNGGANGGTGDSADGEEQEESSSTSNLISGTVNDVLENFRQEWQRELQISPKHKDAEEVKQVEDGKQEDIESRAKALFLKGVEYEDLGKVYEAIHFYKRAVQLVPDIEFRLYESLKTIPRVRHETLGTNDDYSGTYNLPEDFNSDDQDITVDLSLHFQRKIGRNHSVCVPDYEQKSTHISALPTEIILYILRWVVSSNLDVRSLEMCSQVCRGFYLCCRDPEIWRLICLKVWGVYCGRQPDPYHSWRDMYIKRPRLNFNGCYISKTTYIRHGENSFQDQFYRPCHLVEYYRYLRFFPDGIVLMLTTPEEPIQCVSHLRFRLPKLTGVLSGHYRLWKNTVTLLVQRQDIKNSSMNYRRGKRKEASEHSEQTFQLELMINNHHRRKYVQLSWLGYSILTRNRNGLETTSNFDLVGNRYPPFWFSRVKSYTSEADSPLE